MYQLYQRVAPRPEDFPRLLDKIGEAMSHDFDFTEEVRGTSGADVDRRRPTPTWRRQATTSRSSSCSTAVYATAGGMARAGRRAATPSPSSPESRITTSSARRCSRPRRSRSSTSKAGS